MTDPTAASPAHRSDEDPGARPEQDDARQHGEGRGPEPAPSPKPSRTRRPRPHHHRSLRRRLLSENLRVVLSLLLATLIGGLLIVLLPQLSYWTSAPEERLPLLLVLFIVVLSLYSLLFAAMTHYALSTETRARLVATARLTRVRRYANFYRWTTGRSGAASEVLQLLITAIIAILLLAMRPAGVPVTALLLLTAAALVSAWIGAVMTFAVEYAAEDAHGDAFALPGAPGPQRTLADYVFGAVQIQASTGSSDLVPLTSSARRLVRNHVILAHVTSTIIITLGVSAVITAVS